MTIIKNNLIKSINGRPLMILPAAIDAMAGIDCDLTKIQIQKPTMQTLNGEMTGNGGGTVAVISISGPMFHKPGFFDMFFGGSSYDQIRELFFQSVNNDSVDAIVFDLDSNGGDGMGLFDLVDDIYNARGTKPIYAIVNETAYSAAYALASATDKIRAAREMFSPESCFG